jgi:hypothetical protein
MRAKTQMAGSSSSECLCPRDRDTVAKFARVRGGPPRTPEFWRIPLQMAPAHPNARGRMHKPCGLRSALVQIRGVGARSELLVGLAVGLSRSDDIGRPCRTAKQLLLERRQVEMR